MSSLVFWKIRRLNIQPHSTRADLFLSVWLKACWLVKLVGELGLIWQYILNSPVSVRETQESLFQKCVFFFVNNRVLIKFNWKRKVVKLICLCFNLMALHWSCFATSKDMDVLQLNRAQALWITGRINYCYLDWGTLSLWN